jgi:outer membrane protein assembly factor BamA
MWWTSVALGLPSPIPRTALRTGFHFDNQNRLYYGLGNDTKLNDSIEYASLIFRESASGVTRIGRQWRLLTGLQFDQSKLSDYDGRSLPGPLTGNRGGDEAMLSLSLAHDTRDHANNPWFGHYVAATVQVAPALLPGGHDFQKVALDIRGFASPFHRHILAGRVLYQQAFGDVPFYILPEFGGDTLGRGYLPFRVRDRASIIGQFEYRFPVWSFISGAAFVDMGQFRSAPGEFTWAGFHPAFGFGPRFSLGASESSMLGIDVGFTPEGWNLVLHNGQAF